MVSPLTDVRDRKLKMIINTIVICLKILTLKRNKLDKIKYKLISDTLKNLKTAFDELSLPNDTAQTEKQT